MDKLKGQVIWLTGLSAAGKSTLANRVAAELRRKGISVHVLDGDELRRGLCSDLGFTASDRAENVRRAMHVAGLLSETGSIVIVALITPLRTMREMIKTRLPDVLEVFVDAPLYVCEQRDPKGLYKRARTGELAEFTGLNSPFEEPVSPDLTCQTHLESIEDSVEKILTRLVPAENRNSYAEGCVRRRTIAVDFDGVIADYDGWSGSHFFGSVRPDVLKALQELKGEGWKIIVHTTRGAEEIKPYLVGNGVPFDEINENSDYSTGGHKPVATVYWDDRAVRYSGDAVSDLNAIRSLRTWSGRY
jgi:adenylylsulfate kinase